MNEFAARGSVDFIQMKDGTEDEYLFLREKEHEFANGTADRILDYMAAQADETIEGYKITRLTHGLQSATRAYDEGADIDWIVGALLHDISDGLAPMNHDRMAAEIVRPYLREEVTWTIENHGLFQAYYYGHHYGWDRNERDKFKDHPCYQSCVDFCERWDQSSFDPDYPTQPLEFFAPMVREVFARKPYDPAHIRAGAVDGVPPLKGELPPVLQDRSEIVKFRQE